MQREKHLVYAIATELACWRPNDGITKNEMHEFLLSHSYGISSLIQDSSLAVEGGLNLRTKKKVWRGTRRLGKQKGNTRTQHLIGIAASFVHGINFDAFGKDFNVSLDELELQFTRFVDLLSILKHITTWDG